MKNPNIIFILNIFIISFVVTILLVLLVNLSNKEENSSITSQNENQYTIDETAYEDAKYIKITIDIVKETEEISNE